MTMYSAHIEVATRDASRAEHILEQLADYSAAVGTSPRGWLDVQMSLPAETLRQATTTALALVADATGHDPIASEVMTEDEFNAREGWQPVPELVGTTEAAEILGVTRQRVLQLAASGDLPGSPIGGKGRAFPRAAVEAYANRRRPQDAAVNQHTPGESS